MAAALGNNYAGKDKQWARAIKRVLEIRSRAQQVEALDELAERLIELCLAGDLGALKELGDRLDGKPCQQIIATDEDGAPVAIALISYNPSQVRAPALPAPDTEGTGQRH